MPEQEKAADIYCKSQKIPYNYQIILVGDEGTKIVMVEKGGSWVDGLFDVQKLRRLLELVLRPIRMTMLEKVHLVTYTF